MDDVAALAGLLRQSRRTVVFTGAGMSTDPAFRISARRAASGPR
jgi:hypothetical protein